MRTSTARALAGLNSDLIEDPSESEPLLDDESGEEVGEVVVDRAHNYPPTLVEQLHQFQHDIRHLQDRAEVKVNRRVSKQYIFTLLAISGFLTLLTSPASGFYFLWHFLYQKVLDKNKYNDWAGILEADRHNVNHCEHVMNELSQRVKPLLLERDAYLMPYYKSWYQYDDKNTNCEVSNDPNRELHQAQYDEIFSGNVHPTNFMFSRLYYSDDFDARPQYCRDIALEASKVEDSHYDTHASIYDLSNQISDVSRSLSYFKSQVGSDQQNMNMAIKSGILLSSFVVGLSGILVLVLGGFVGACAYRSGKKSWGRLPEAKDKLRTLQDNMTAELADKLRQLPMSLCLDSAVALADLQQQLLNEVANAEVRARKRAAFVSLKNYDGTGFAGFFSTPGHREACRLIFQRAELYLPRKQYVPK